MRVLNLGRLFGVIIVACIVILSGCATQLKPQSEPESYALPANKTSLAWVPLQQNLPDQRSVSWFDLQDIAPDALRWRLALIDTATVSIDAQYFIWNKDAVGSLMLERVIQAADRGVRVRLLIDDSFLSGEDALMLAVDAHPHIEMRIFNPFQLRSSSMVARYIENLNDFERTNHRMHNKLLISDGQAAIVGGRNIANEYFGFSEELNFRTFDVLTTGAVLPEISNSFDKYWNSGWAFPITQVDRKKPQHEDLSRLRDELRTTAAVLDSWQELSNAKAHDWSAAWADMAQTMLPGDASLVQDDPLIEQDSPVQLGNYVETIISEADTDVMLISAYLVPSEDLLEIAQTLTNKGVRFRALTNSLASNNHLAAHTAYRHRRKQLLEAGVELYELRADAPERVKFEAPGVRAKHVGLHAKIQIVDSRRVFVGTLNIDPRSMILNTEVNLLVESPPLAEAILNAFSSDFQTGNSWLVELDEQGEISWISGDERLDHQPAGSIWRRMGDFLSGLLPLDQQM